MCPIYPPAPGLGKSGKFRHSGKFLALAENPRDELPSRFLRSLDADHLSSAIVGPEIALGLKYVNQCNQQLWRLDQLHLPSSRSAMLWDSQNTALQASKA